MGSTFNPMMGYFRANKIGCHNWGFVSGSASMIFPPLIIDDFIVNFCRDSDHHAVGQLVHGLYCSSSGLVPRTYVFLQ